MIVQVSNCRECPFCNNDFDTGNTCNLADKLKINMKMGFYDMLPDDRVHEDCPIDGKVEVVVANFNEPKEPSTQDLCGGFVPDSTTTSATKCQRCGREKWEHPEKKN